LFGRDDAIDLSLDGSSGKSREIKKQGLTIVREAAALELTMCA
jgi:hypothetical protein